MNEHVTYGLNLYIKDTDPQSAILLKGDWGCGKTHFIKEWMQVQKQDKNSVCDVVYVSLFGISSLRGLKDAINKAISPMMYKVEKYGKDVLKAAAKIVLKYDSTIADVKDAKFQYELNPLDLLSQLNLSENSKEYKLFVFDDVERCDISLKELFGFVDYLFEHVGCRVVLVVGNTDLQDDRWKETLHKYQEKIVGREYVIEPEVNVAVSAFVDEIQSIYPSSYTFLSQHKEAIVAVWKSSKYNNLRSLRQCIRSFVEILESLNKGAEKMKFQFFLNYLAYSLEYYNGDKKILSEIAVHQIAGYYNNNSPAKTILDKYNEVWSKLNCRLFELEYLTDIKKSVFEGKDITEELNWKIKSIEEKSLYERLRNIIFLENRDVDKLISEAKSYLRSPVVNVMDYIYIAYVLFYWEEKSVCILKKSFERDCLNKILAWLRINMIPSQLAITERQIHRGFEIQDREVKIERFSWLASKVGEAMTELKNEVKEPILNLLENISNENVEEVVSQMYQVDIYQRAHYTSQALFNRLNVKKFCLNVKKLNNKSKMYLTEGLDVRYGQNYSDNDYRSIFGEEKSALEEIVINVEEYQKRSTKMTKVVYSRLMTPIKHALERLN
ncbi:MAG: KAP family NTPase [Bacteroidales bacterium]|nr:KAP family NTPase [Bacteroidales bacterium]